VLQNSVTNTALPTIVHSLHVTSAASIWVVNAVQLATLATLLFFGATSDARGTKKVYLAGMSVFTLATLGCALATSFDFLIAMRVLQGLGAAAVAVTINSLNRALFAPGELGRSVSVNTIFVAVGTAVGPTIGGAVLAFASWQWIFGLNVPLGIIALVLGWRYLPSIPPTGTRLDYRSGVLAAVAFGGLFYALDAFARPQRGFIDAAVGAAGAVAMVLFVRRQLHLAHPMLAVDLFRVPIFSVSVAASSATYAAQSIAYVTLPFFFQSVLGKTPWESGLLLSAWAFMSFFVAVRIGRISDRYPSSLLCTIGVVVLGTALAGFALLPALPSTFAIVACAAVAGAGFATFQTPNNRAILVTATPEMTGRAAGVMTTARVGGQTLGAVLTAIVFEVAGSAAGAGGVPVRSVIETALLVACGCIAIAAVLSSIRLRAGLPAARSVPLGVEIGGSRE
jgi:DHA2 family multidrug resistance protein-like MFS transporter